MVLKMCGLCVQRDIEHNIQYFQHGNSLLQCIIDTKI